MGDEGAFQYLFSMQGSQYHKRITPTSACASMPKQRRPRHQSTTTHARCLLASPRGHKGLAAGQCIATVSEKDLAPIPDSPDRARAAGRRGLGELGLARPKPRAHRDDALHALTPRLVQGGWDQFVPERLLRKFVRPRSVASGERGAYGSRRTTPRSVLGRPNHLCRYSVQVTRLLAERCHRARLEHMVSAHVASASASWRARVMRRPQARGGGCGSGFAWPKWACSFLAVR